MLSTSRYSFRSDRNPKVVMLGLYVIYVQIIREYVQSNDGRLVRFSISRALRDIKDY